MPSLHAADALIAGVILASVVRQPVFKVLWLLWPAWVWFAVMATGNHFWLDVLAGIVLARDHDGDRVPSRVQGFIARLL